MNWSQCDCVCVRTSIFLITDLSSSLARLCIYPLFSLYDHDQILWFAPSPQQQIPRVTFQQTSSSLFAGQTGCLHTRFSFIMMTSGEAYSQYFIIFVSCTLLLLVHSGLPGELYLRHPLFHLPIIAPSIQRRGKGEKKETKQSTALCRACAAYLALGVMRAVA